MKPPEPAARRCHVLMLSGSLRAGSTNTAVIRTGLRLLPPDCKALRYKGMADLPHFSPDRDKAPLPPEAADLRARLAWADALMISTPEYAGSLPGSFKNLLDWCVGSPDLQDTPVGWINASAQGGARSAHEDLRTVLGFLNVRIVAEACREIPVSRSTVARGGLIEDEAIRCQIHAALTALVAAAGTHPHDAD